MKIDKVFEGSQKQRQRFNREKHKGRQKHINRVDSQAQTYKNSRHDHNKRRKTRSQRYSEGGKMKKIDA